MDTVENYQETIDANAEKIEAKQQEDMMATIKEAQELIRKQIQEFTDNSPMWIRVNYILATLDKSIKEGFDENEVNWNAVDETLHKNIDQYDFNIIDKVTSVADLFDIRERLTTADVLPHMAWRRCNCRDCHKTFYLSRSEVKFYQDKKLNTPKRCKDCREKRKANQN